MKKSNWIWCPQQTPTDYNQTVLFKKEIDLADPSAARIEITADSWYRLIVNGKWINDGPARAYPDHWQHDTHDISAALQPGKNHIEVIVRYFGIGTFHQIPQQAGLRATLLVDGQNIGTGTDWLATPSKAWKQWTPKISVQMEPVEEYDARFEKELDWQPAVLIKRPGKISPRNTALLTKKSRQPIGKPSRTTVQKPVSQWVVPATQLCHPGLIEANLCTSRPLILCGKLTVSEKQPFDFSSKEWKIAINGRLLKTGKVTLTPGKYNVRFFSRHLYGHNKEFAFSVLEMPGTQWIEWRASVADEYLFADVDIPFEWFDHKEAIRIEERWHQKIQKNPDFEGRRLHLPLEQIFMRDTAAEFALRKPSDKGDPEYCFDFGDQICGYIEFNLKAEAGVQIDFNLVEYITPEGVIQHTMPFNRNGFRYTAKDGINRFTSLKRRSGRYLFLTVRDAKKPVEIKSVRIIEATAPVKPARAFKCSDPMLNKVWKMSERTLQLCMEDTFTDCPLYEQTLWIGDARNEALYAFTAYGNTDVSARSLELGAQSLEKFQMVGCQVPSSWDCILPAWSFLWGMHVWEHYFHSGNKRLLKKLWPAVQKNIAGAKAYIDSETGLFRGKHWNLLEWAAIDHKNETVLHNSLLFCGALLAAEKCADALGEPSSPFRTLRKKLAASVNAFWDDTKQSYPDALLDTTGKPSPKTCQHTSMLALMCEVLPEKNKSAALKNLLNPPQGMTPVASPFAMQFLFEALEKAQEYDAIIKSIRTHFKSMIDRGATTVWEMFDGAAFDAHGFPTRSHCHAWSSSPILFLNRIVLGIRPAQAGGKAFEISPWIGDLESASGATATPHGPVSVEWKRDGDRLTVKINAPRGVTVRFVPNASHPEKVAVSCDR
jgi:hypothetical protein